MGDPLRHVQRSSVLAIKKAGGSVTYDWEWNNSNLSRRGRPWAPKWLVDAMGVDYFGHVTHVVLVERGSDSELVPIGRLSRLEELNLFGSPVTDAGLVHLKELTRLRTLYLIRTKVTDLGLEHLRGLTSLQRLYLNNTRVSGPGFVHLERLNDLQVLNVNETPVNDTGLKYLERATSLRA